MKINYEIRNEPFVAEIDSETLDRAIAVASEQINKTATQKGYEISPKYTLEEHLAVSIQRDFLDKEDVELGEIPVISSSKRDESANAETGTINICLKNKDDGSETRQSFSQDQNIGAVKAHLREKYDVPLEDEIIVTYENSDEAISSNSLISELKSERLLWQTVETTK